MLPQFLQDITSAAPASRDAKSCVSRADTAYFHRHTYAASYSAKFPRETQNLASLLYLYTLSSAIYPDLVPTAPACRDAKSCVSRADTAYFHRHTSAPPYSAKFPRETQNLASLLYLYTLSLANIHTAISRKANSGDARFCVSTLFAHTFIGIHSHRHIAQTPL